jgi:predicted PurR-regulated permease PerM
VSRGTFLRTASELFIPIVVAVLASYALEPIVKRLHRIRIPPTLLALAITSLEGWVLLP